MTSEQDLVRIAQQQQFESKRQSVEAKLQSGQTLNIYEAIFLSKYYPDVSRQVASQQQGQTPVIEGHVPSWYVPLAPASERQQVVAEEPVRQPSIAETLMGYKVKPVFSQLGLKIISDPLVSLGLKEPTGIPFAAMGAAIAPFEGISYVLARAVGLKTPDMPPLPSIENREYAVGYVLGEAGELFLSSFVIGKVVSGTLKLGEIVEQKVGVPKFGDVTVPLESGEEVRWRGLYWSKGEGATMLAGKMSDVPEDAVILSHGLTGEGAGYVPISNIESEVTLRIMEKTGYPSETVQDVRDVRAIMGITQDTKSKFIEDLLPSRTRTLSESGVSTLKEFVLSNDEQVEELYGSFATKPQVSKEFEYILETETGSISALREPGDIDIQLKVGQEGAVKFTKDLAARLQDAGEDVRVSPERATLIETRVDLDKYAHAVDIHFKGEEADLMNPMSERAWGFTLQRAKVKIENIELMGASEQGLRKGVSILGFTEEQGLGPVAHRLKDIPDFFQVQETLLESKSDMQGQILLARLEPRFGVKDLADTDVIIQERYLVSPASQASKASLVLSVGISAALMAKQSMAMSKSSYTLSPYINLGASKLLESSVKLPSSFLNLQSSKTTVPSMPSTKLFVPTSPSLSSVFSLPKGSPSIPSSPSIPRYPSPSHPSPSYPTYPSNKQYMDILKKDFTPFKRKGGNWARRYMWEFPVKGPKELLKVV